MHNSSNRLSISPERPMDPLTLQALKLLDELLRRERIPDMRPLEICSFTMFSAMPSFEEHVISISPFLWIPGTSFNPSKSSFYRSRELKKAANHIALNIDPLLLISSS